MNRRIAVVALVVLVALSGCAGLFDGGTTSTATTTGTTTTGTTTSTTTETMTTATTTTTAGQYDDVPPGVDASGRLTDPGSLFEAHTAALTDGGYASTAEVRIRPQSDRDAPGRVLRYDVSVSDGGAPYRIRLNRSVGNTTTGLQTIWGNETARFVQVRQADGSGGFETNYQRQSREPPEIDPGLVAVQRVLVAGDYRIESIDGEGEDRRFVLVATEPAPDALSDAPTNVTGYEGELVVDDRGRIREARVEMEYVNGRGAQLVSTVTYGIDRQEGVGAERPSWIDQVVDETRDFEIDARSVDDSYIEVTNTGSEPIGRNYTIAVATNSGAGVLEPNESVAPGESFYIYQRQNGTVRIGHEEPTDAIPLEGEFRIAVLTPDGNPVADDLVEVGS